MEITTTDLFTFRLGQKTVLFRDLLFAFLAYDQPKHSFVKLVNVDGPTFDTFGILRLV